MSPDCEACGHPAMDHSGPVAQCTARRQVEGGQVEYRCACGGYVDPHASADEEEERIRVVVGFPNGLVIDGQEQFIMRDFHTTAATLAKITEILEKS